MDDDPLTAELEFLRSRHRQHVSETFPAPGICTSDRHRWPCHAHVALAALGFLLKAHAAYVTRDEHDRLVAILRGEAETDG